MEMNPFHDGRPSRFSVRIIVVRKTVELDTQRIIDEVTTEQLNAEDFFVEPEDADTHDFILPELVDLTNEVGEVLSRLSDDKQALILDKMISALDPTPRAFVRYNGFIPLVPQNYENLLSLHNQGMIRSLHHGHGEPTP